MTVRSRPFWLGIVGFSLVLTAGKWAIAPTHRSYTPIDFSDEMVIETWQVKRQQHLVDSGEEPSRYDQVLSGHFYEYTQNQMRLRIELRDLFTTTGDVNQFLKNHLQIHPESLQIQDHRFDAGYYRLFKHHHQTYLSSCIDVNGRATVTPEQFRHNRYQYDWQGDRLLRWAIGQVSLLEQRCLWVLISTPTDTTDSEASQKLVEQVWQDNWRRWRYNP